jgi:hypothetical protein
MMTRTTTASVAGRSVAMRRMRRRAQTASQATTTNRYFCRTNGCPSFLQVDPARGIATCEICGYTRRLH